MPKLDAVRGCHEEIDGIAHAPLAERYAVELRLSDAAAESAGLRPLVQAVAELTGKSCHLLDAEDRTVACASSFGAAPVPVPPLRELLVAVGPHDAQRSEPTIVAPARSRGIARRHLITPVVRDGHEFGWLVVAEHPTSLCIADSYAAQRAAMHLAREFRTQQRIARAAWDARATLVRQLLRGTSADGDLRACAEYLGVDLEAERVLAYVAQPSPEFDAERLALLVADNLRTEVLPVRGSEGVVLAAACDERDRRAFVDVMKQAVGAALCALGAPRLAAGLSTVAGPARLRRAYREAHEVAVCVGRFADPNGARVVAADDLGPARLFIANSNTAAVRTFVHDVLGSLLTGEQHAAGLLRTLQCFFRTGRSVRETARSLGVHENTVRLRLAKVYQLTGFDVATASNDQLSVQTALLVVRLQGHPTVPAFTEEVLDHGKSA